VNENPHQIIQNHIPSHAQVKGWPIMFMVVAFFNTTEINFEGVLQSGM
jgi:hypothetical protein